MKQETKKHLLETVKKTVKISAGRGDSLICPVIFHQPKRPVKKK